MVIITLWRPVCAFHGNYADHPSSLKSILCMLNSRAAPVPAGPTFLGCVVGFRTDRKGPMCGLGPRETKAPRNPGAGGPGQGRTARDARAKGLAQNRKGPPGGITIDHRNHD